VSNTGKVNCNYHCCQVAQLITHHADWVGNVVEGIVEGIDVESKEGTQDYDLPGRDWVRTFLLQLGTTEREN
jgi:hypothetical protein